MRYHGCRQARSPTLTDENTEPAQLKRIFLTFAEAQQFLGVSHQTLYKLINKGLPSHKIGRRRVFFREDLVQWITNH